MVWCERWWELKTRICHLEEKRQEDIKHKFRYLRLIQAIGGASEPFGGVVTSNHIYHLDHTVILPGAVGNMPKLNLSLRLAYLKGVLTCSTKGKRKKLNLKQTLNLTCLYLPVVESVAWPCSVNRDVCVQRWIIKTKTNKPESRCRRNKKILTLTWKEETKKGKCI